MNLSFSTRGRLGTPWPDLCGMAMDNGFTGIEVYDAYKDTELIGPGGVLHKYNAASTHRDLSQKGLTVPVLDSSCNIGFQDPAVRDNVLFLIGLAEALQTEYVAIRSDQSDLDAVMADLDVLLSAAKKSGIVLLLKTNGVFSNTARLRALLDRYATDHLGVLWDVYHPYRDCGETPDETIKNLGAYVKHVHLRDSDSAGSYTLVGEGNMPLADFIRALYSVDYAGYLSLEWKTEWMEDLPEMDVILPHFVNYMQRFSSTRGKKKMLYPNHDGTGWYVWKKDELIDLTFSQVLDRMVEEFPDQYCFKYTTLDYTRTYSEFQGDVDRFARALISLGVRAGSKVAVWATNVPEWYLAFWATTKIGAVLVTVNTAYKIHETEYLLRQSDTHTLIMIESALDSNYKETIEALCPELAATKPGEPLHCRKLPFLRNVITVGFRMSGCLTFEEAMQRSEMTSQRELEKMASRVRPDDVCNMQYTSGTTGFPKGVMLTHYNIINNGKCIGDRMGLSTADRMMIQVPMFHCFGMVLSMTSSLTHGATVCPIPYFSAKSALACIQQEKITCFNGVPTMFIAMFNHPDYKRTDFSHMRTGIMAGSGCPPELMRRAADPSEMHMIGIVSVYGQTESSPGSTMSAWTDPLDVRCDTVGYDFPHVQCKIIDPDTGKELPDGQNGEFCSKGYNTMKGYYKMPDATRDTVDAEGWLHSGDIACRDAQGNYRITGRLKDMIIRGGENIYPKEIEEFIYTHPYVQDVQVIGVPDRRYGEEALACIILKEGCSLSEPEMRAYITASLARHKVPRYIEFVDSFPMNAAGKILKYKMREDAVVRLGLS